VWTNHRICLSKPLSPLDPFFRLWSGADNGLNHAGAVCAGKSRALGADDVENSMSRWRRSASKALAATSLGLLAMLVGSSAGCEFISRVDRSDIPNGGGGGGGGGTGGAGGGCATAQDCPGTDTVCRSRTCTDGVCGFADAPAGTATDNQTTGDCLREVCDGQGTVTTEPDDADILNDQSDCTTDICVAGQPQNMPLAAGAPCTTNGGKVCDGAGTCVECAHRLDGPG